MAEPLPFAKEAIDAAALQDPSVLSADPLNPEHPNHDASFIEQVYVSYLIPFHTNVDIEGLLGAARIGSSLALDSIEQRESLFFGELILSAFLMNCL